MTDDPTPGLYEEDYVFARLLEILFKHTEIGRDELCSCGNRLANDLIAYLAEEDFPLEITGEFGGYIFAKVTPEGRALLEQLRAEEGRDRARKDSLPP